MEIPLLRESVSFSSRLAQAARAYNESTYATHRRINWSHRYADQFYAHETNIFVKDSERYLTSAAEPPSQLEDVFEIRLSPSALAAATAKVFAHRSFALLGKIQRNLPGAFRARVYRKCYVDDIEFVFDPDATDTLRAVYPFPLSMRRQIAYLQRIWREGRRFRFAGHSYLLTDLWRLLRRRDVRSLMRMEARAQLAHARELFEQGYAKIEMSDEFNLGSLEFARAIDRLGIDNVNSAHGVGKYLPVHAYQTFITITDVQQDYYIAVRPCRYERRKLNDALPEPCAIDDTRVEDDTRVRVVLLSQTFAGLTGIIPKNEVRIQSGLAAEFANHPGIDLLFKPHPTQGQRPPPPGFETLGNLADVNGKPGTVFVSQFSTCQINPTFKGYKVLLRGELVHPEIAFDSDEPILTLDELIEAIRTMVEADAPNLRKAALNG